MWAGHNSGNERAVSSASRKSATTRAAPSAVTGRYAAVEGVIEVTTRAPASRP